MGKSVLWNTSLGDIAFPMNPGVAADGTNTLEVNALQIDTGTKTAQAASGAATLNKMSGVITTDSLTTAAGADYTLTLTDSDVAAGDSVFANIQGGTNSTGVPVLLSATPGAGEIVFVVANLAASAALNGTLKIAFMVVKN
jgi:hypothetical protein